MATKTTTQFEVRIGDIVPLHDAGIKGASVVSRKIDESNLQAMLYSVSDLPPILVQKRGENFVLVGGHHRLQAYTLAAVREHAIQSGKWPRENGVPLSADLDVFRKIWESGEFTPEETAYANDEKVVCRDARAQTDLEICRKAWQDNRSNGMPPAKNVLGRYGLWLYQQAKENGLPLSYEDCAREAGCSKSTIINYATRHAGDESLGEGEMAVEAKEAPSLESAREKDARTLVKALRNFYRHTDEMTRNELAILLSQAFEANEHDIPVSLADILKDAGSILADEYSVASM